MIFVVQILVFNQYDEYYTLKPISLLKEVQEGTNCTLISVREGVFPNLEKNLAPIL